MLNKYHFIDKSDDSDTKVLASTFDFAYLIFCTCYGFYEVDSVYEFSPGVFHVNIHF